MKKKKCAKSRLLSEPERRVVSYVVGCLLFCIEQLEAMDHSISISEFKKHTLSALESLNTKVH